MAVVFDRLPPGRFQKAMDSAKQGEDMWVLLASANLHDAKIKKVCERVAGRRTIIILHAAPADTCPVVLGIAVLAAIQRDVP